MPSSRWQSKGAAGGKTLLRNTLRQPASHCSKRQHLHQAKTIDTHTRTVDRRRISKSSIVRHFPPLAAAGGDPCHGWSALTVADTEILTALGACGPTTTLFINRMTSFSMCIPFHVFHTRPFVSVHFFQAAKWLTGRSSEFTSAFGFVLDRKPLLVAPACPTKPIVDILNPTDSDLKIPPRFELMILQMQLVGRWMETMTVQCRLADCNGSQFFAAQIRPKEKLRPEKKTRSSLITSVSLSNDCTAGDLHSD